MDTSRPTRHARIVTLHESIEAFDLWWKRSGCKNTDIENALSPNIICAISLPQINLEYLRTLKIFKSFVTSQSMYLPGEMFAHREHTEEGWYFVYDFSTDLFLPKGETRLNIVEACAIHLTALTFLGISPWEGYAVNCKSIADDDETSNLCVRFLSSGRFSIVPLTDLEKGVEIIKPQWINEPFSL